MKASRFMFVLMFARLLYSKQFMGAEIQVFNSSLKVKLVINYRTKKQKQLDDDLNHILC
jgi:hypothetical protein